MVGKKVAVEDEVIATPGSVLSTKTAAGAGSSAPTGQWTAKQVTYTSYDHLEVGGAKVIWKAECTFEFSGTDISGATVTDSEDVTLLATSKLLNKDQNSVLVDGDSKSSPVYQNKLEVSAAGPLTTS